MMTCRRFVFPFLLILMFSPWLHAEGSPSRSLVIVSSFPPAMTQIFETAFERLNPQVDVQIIKKKTSAGIRYVEENKADLFWVSAPDAFEVLKQKRRLEKYSSQEKGMPRRVSGYPVNDPDGFYSGFAVAGYGIMWNTQYLAEHGLPQPKEWVDLVKPVYFGHIGLSSPARSGTTHLTAEAILQLKGWDKGWSLLKAISANAKLITQKSSDVPKGVVAGDFGIGIVIDFYGLAEQAKGHPVRFSYPSFTVLVPASIGLLKDAPNRAVAEKFIDFILSKQGQKLLLEPAVSRLPVRPDVYFEGVIPKYYPQPYGRKALGSHKAFNVSLSRQRYEVVNALFDVMITDRLKALNAVVRVLQKEEVLLAALFGSQTGIAASVARAHRLIDKVPITERESIDPKLAVKFASKHVSGSGELNKLRVAVEKRWGEFARANYHQASVIMDSVEFD